MAIIKKAGAIVLSQKDPQFVALLYRAKEKDWSFPKGHVEDGENIQETTRREIMEETGLPVHLIANTLPSIKYIHKNGNNIIIYMFIVQSENDSLLKKEFANDKIIWVNYKEVKDKLSYDNIKKYYQSVYKEIEKTIIGLQPKIH